MQHCKSTIPQQIFFLENKQYVIEIIFHVSVYFLLPSVIFLLGSALLDSVIR